MSKTEIHLSLMEIARERLRHDIHFLEMLKDQGVIPEVAYSAAHLSKYLVEESIKRIKEELSQ